LQEKINASKAVAELCRRSLFEFVQEFWDVIIPEDPVWNWHIEYLCDEIQTDVMRVVRLSERTAIFEGIRFKMPAKPREPKLHDVVINVPPGTSKSTILSVMMPAWVWVVDPTIQVLTASYSGDLSQDLSVKSRDIIKSEKYRRYFPEVEIRSDEDTKNDYKNTKGGRRLATSVGGTATGKHFHIIVCDDLLNPKQAASAIQILDACDFMNTTLSSRKVDKKISITFLIMQRLNELDPTGNWLRKRDQDGKRLKHICLPGRLTTDVRPPELATRYVDGLLDPVRLDHEALLDMKIDLGSYGFAGQVEQNPAPEGGGVWQKWFISVPDKDFPSTLTSYGTDWDTAYTDKLKNAGSAAVVSGMFGGKMYIDSVQWFHKEFPELINTMKLFPDPHYIEAKASGKSAKQTLITAGIPAIEVQVNGDKLARARDATPKAEAGLVYCRASILEKIYYDADQGILKFPNGAKQDLADTIAQAIQRHFGRPERKFIIGWRKKPPIQRGEPAVSFLKD
jgi:predicted phage terminase large subunit-like protein